MSNPKYYDKAKRILEQRRSRANALNEAAAEILERSSDYAALDSKRSVLFQMLFDANKKNKPVDDIAAQIENINSEIANLASSLGLTLDNYECKSCEDTGEINGVYCKCLKQLIEEIKREETGLTQLPAFNFDDHIKGLNPILDKIYPKLIEYCSTFPDNNVKQLVFNGGVGVGKSCLAAAIANSVSDKGFTVQYIKSNAMNDLFLKYHTSPYAERDGILSPLLDADLLIIDDLGIEPLLNNVTLPYLYILLESRDKLHTIITTNLEKDEVKSKYKERIFSRLFDMEKSLILSLLGNDLRLIKK